MSGTSIIRRTTLYILFEAIETDLRNIISTQLVPNYEIKQLFGPQQYEAMLTRFQKDNGTSKEHLPDDLLQFSDLGDLITILDANRGVFSEGSRQAAEALKILKKLTPIRHRVMHYRPLEFSDYETVTETAILFAKKYESLCRRTFNAVQTLRKAPETLAAYEYSGYRGEDTNVLNNLPDPDFDDTGFFARTKEYDLVRKAILSAYPVVTLLGEGGVGKTSLALKVCYDLLDEVGCPFELIIWSSAKTRVLTVSGIADAKNAITTSIGLFASAANASGLEPVGSDPVEALTSLLSSFRTLLVIDNLETIKDDVVERFLENIPPGSKVVLTSRISLGKLDFPIKIGPLLIDDAVRYFRMVATALSVSSLQAIDQLEVLNCCNKLRNNPLWMKWFIQAVRAGARKEELLANPKEPLAFCMENVFDKISQNGQHVLNAMLCVGGDHTVPRLCFITDLDASDIREAMNELQSVNAVLVRSGKSQGPDTFYALEDLVRIYLVTLRSPSREIQELYRLKRHKLQDMIAHRESALRDPYDWNSICTLSDADVVTATLLAQVNALIKKGRFQDALDLLAKAEAQSPSYFEVYRIKAILFQHMKNYIEARRYFEIAIDFAPDHAPLRLWYGQFLWKEEADLEGAIQQLQKGLSADKLNSQFISDLAVIYMMRRDFSTAEQVIGSFPNFSELPIDKKNRVLAMHRLEFFLRRSENHLENAQSKESLEDLLAFHKEYGRLERFIDNAALERFEKYSVLFLKLARELLNADLVKLLKEEARWFATTIARSPQNQQDLNNSFELGIKTVGPEDYPAGWFSGRIKTLEKTYGFISGEFGISYHFPLNSLRGNLRRHNMSMLDRYAFRIGESSGKTIAIDIYKESEAFEFWEKGVVSKVDCFPYNGSKAQGTVIKAMDNYGFIEVSTGETFHFRKSAVVGGFMVPIGAQVEFFVLEGEPNKPRAATRVSPQVQNNAEHNKRS